jgi:hypothetical protein
MAMPQFKYLVLSFLAPPIATVLVWLGVRIAIHFSLWGAVPLYPVAFIFCGTACVAAAWHFAAQQTGWRIPVWFATWLVSSIALAFLGLAIVDALPITVGDGP